MFGRSYEPIGSTTTDLLLKTRGQVKLQIGNKFIDLIKDQKLNVNSEFIFQESPGIRNGIYVYDDKVTLVINGEQIDLIGGEIGTTYVSFLEGQETDSDAKHNALVNIGFLYNSLEEVTDKALQNGIIYVEDTQKLYIIKDGNPSEFSVEFPSMLHTQLQIAKEGYENSYGSLRIFGKGLEQGIIIDTFKLYDNEDNSVIDAFKKLIIAINEQPVIEIDDNSISTELDLSINDVHSPNASGSSGFRMYMSNGRGIIEADEVIDRSKYEKEKEINFQLFPEYFFKHNNIIKSVEEEEDNIYNLFLNFPNKFKINDLVCVYTKEYLEESEEDDFILKQLKLRITSVEEDFITVKSETPLIDLEGSFIFLISNYPLRLKENNLDIMDYSDPDNPKVKTRIGDLGNDEYGITTDIGKYNEENTIPILDNSTKFASTQWVNQFALNFIINKFVVGSHFYLAPDLTIKLDLNQLKADLAAL